MIKLFLSIYSYFVKHRPLLIIIFIVGLIAALFLAANLHYEENIAEFLPQNKQIDKYESVYNNLGSQNKIVVIFSKDSNTDLNRMTGAMDAFGLLWHKVDKQHVVKDMQVSIDDSQIIGVSDFIADNYPYFMTDADYARIDSLLKDDNYISGQLDLDKHLLMLPTAGILTRNMATDPLHFFTPIFSRLQTLKVSDNYQVNGGYILNKTDNKGFVFFSSPYGISESKMNQTLADKLDDVISRLKVSYPEIHVSAVGAPLIAVTNASQIKKDSILSITLAVVLIFVVLIYSFRRISDLLWIGASLLFGWMFALGGIAIFRDRISIIVIGISSVIIGIAVNYPLHFLDHLKHESDRKTALREMVPPLLIGNITTVGAFLCLIFLDADAMRDLGLFGSLVLIGTILFVLIFLPVLVSQRKPTTNHFELNVNKLPLTNKVSKKWIFAIFSILTIIFAYFSFNTSFDSDMQHINYMTDAQRADIKTLQSSMADPDSVTTMYAVAEGNNINEALKNNELMINKMHSDLSGVKYKVSGINNFLPSASLQRQRIDKWNSFWKSHSDVIRVFDAECAKKGFSNTAFYKYKANLNKHYLVHDASFFNPLTLVVGSNFVQQSDSTTRIINYVKVPKHNARKLRTIMNTGHSFVFDTSDISSQLVTILSNNFNYIGFVCGFIVFFFLWISFGRLELSLLSFLPLAVGWLWILGIMDLSSLQFNIVNIILATFIFGQGDDYTIFITEGLMYEYAYGKKMLASYKNSVALSAVIMFIGMGTLILSRHPAMRSLAEVSVVGMITVVGMAYYLPPMVFRWLTMANGQKRDVPITIKRLTYSLFSLLSFILGIFLFMLPYTFLYFLIGKKSDKKVFRYHRFLQVVSKFVIYRVPGVDFSYTNSVEEHFDKPAVIISNHQSHLDLMCIMMLTPKLVILTKDWVWKNPFYGKIIQHAEFYPVSDGMEQNEERLRSLVSRGYSVVIFPEGTRSADCKIQRFHQGAFYLAQKLQLDIIPIYLHGVGHVLPKKDFMLRQGSIHMEIGQRIRPIPQTDSPSDILRITRDVHRMYVNNYNGICERIENYQYFLPYVRYKYMYKGHDVERTCKAVLSRISRTGIIDYQVLDNGDVVIDNCYQGETALLYALTNKEKDVYAYIDDQDRFKLASHCSCIPSNLHFIMKEK